MSRTVKKLRILCSSGVSDPLLFWLCKTIDDVEGIECRVYVPKAEIESTTKVAPAFAQYISSETVSDRVVCLFRSAEDASTNPDWAFGLSTKSAVVVGKLEEETGYSAAATRMSYVLGLPIETFVPELGMSAPFVYDKADGGILCRDPERPLRIGWFGLDEDILLSAVDGMISNSGAVRSAVISTGKNVSKLDLDRIRIPVWALDESFIDFILSQVDVFVDLSEKVSGDMHHWVLQQARALGMPVFARWNDANNELRSGVIRGAGDPGKFAHYVFSVLSADPDLRRYPPIEPLQTSIEAGRRAATALLGPAEPPRSVRSAQRTAAPTGAIFFATNGHGLGHAQRVTTISEATRALVTKDEITVATFPSCFEFVGSRGFRMLPLVTRQVATRDVAVETANLKRLKCALRSSKLFTFDGGHPYDSVIAAIQSFNGRSVWIRRGLWQQSSKTLRSLARQKFFDHVVIPLEAFDELNYRVDDDSVSTSTFGPIVSPPENLSLTKQYLDKLKRGKRGLCVTMLGSISDPSRIDSLRTVLHWFEDNDDFVNVVVMWPQSEIRINTDQYQNSHFVKTVWGTSFVHESDFVIAASGYNVFHECLYYRKPAIYVPQGAAWLDYQQKRAKSASERDLAVYVDQDDLAALLAALNSLSAGGLATLKSNLETFELPEPGVSAIAQFMKEIGELR